MLGLRLAFLGVAALLVSGFSIPAFGQDVVPGGWSMQVNFQSFDALAGSPDRNAFGQPWMFTPNAPGNYAVAQGFYASPLGPAFQVQPQVVNGLLPLSDVIRRQSRKPRRR